MLLLVVFSCTSVEPVDKVTEERPKREVKYTGLRSSSYGVTPFPSPKKWQKAFDMMQSYYPESTPAGIWIIGNIENGKCSLQFPKPKGVEGDFSGITFAPRDKHEKYLTYFDEVGIKVFLQVESGCGDMETLINVILKQYGHHKSVIGYGVDLEWYAPNGERGMNGESYFAALDTDTAMVWDAKVKSFNPEYRMFLKHWIWDETIMPQNTQSDIIFISDSQGFINYVEAGNNKRKRALDSMIWNFTVGWAENFRKNDNIRSVGFQIGYESDRKIWKDLFNKPYPANLCNSILKNVPEEQEVSFFWVDFTLNEVFY